MAEPSHSEDLARMRAEMDQAKEGMREFAGSAFAFYQGLTEAGFCEEHALQLTVAFLTTLIQSAPLSGMAAEAGEVFKRMFGEGE